MPRPHLRRSSRWAAFLTNKQTETEKHQNTTKKRFWRQKSDWFEFLGFRIRGRTDNQTTKLSDQRVTSIVSTETTMKQIIGFLVFVAVVAAVIAAGAVEIRMWEVIGWKTMMAQRLVLEPIAEFVMEVVIAALGG